MPKSRVLCAHQRGRTASIFVLGGIAVALLVLGAARPARAQSAADLVLRLDRLEAENRRLNGEVEEMRFQVRRMEEALRKAQSDADIRLGDLEGTRGRTTPGPRAGAIQTPPITPGPPTATLRAGRGDAFDPSLQVGAPGAPRPLGPADGTLRAGSRLSAGVVPPGGAVLEDEADAPLDLANPPGTPRGGVARSAAVVATGNPRSDYALAKALLDQGDFERSETAFREFLRVHGRDRLVPDAVYGLGESFYNRTRYREAAEQYLSVTTDHATSARAPEAMLRLGMSLKGLGAKEEACGTYAQVTRKYPQASPALRQALERERRRAQC